MLKLPIIDMLLNYKRTLPLSFHVPGHRNGQLINKIKPKLSDKSFDIHLNALETLMEFDVTELSITDDLHDPQGAIGEAQRLAASLYGVKHTFFLVGGSTAGNIAAILATCEPNDYVIVQRNVHKSVINGCKLAGVNVVFVNPSIDKQSQYSTIPELEVLKRAIQKYPQAKAVFLTSPNYYGVSANLSEYASFIHRKNMLLIVDEAHGAHYSFHPQLPQSALRYGADIVIQSTHKTLPSVTMSAMLHINTTKVDREHIQQQLALIESSSPSFLMLASLDIARAAMQYMGHQLVEQSLELRDKLINFLNKNKYNLLVEQYSDSKEDNQEVMNYYYDPLRLHIYDKLGYYTGYELQHIFEQHGIWAEMATSQHCIFVLHLGYTEEEYEQLISRLERIHSTIYSSFKSKKIELNKRVSSYYNSNHIGEPILMSRAISRQTKIVDINDALGYISGEMVVPYPPGIPILYEGELITVEIINEINHYIMHHAKFQASETIANGKIKIIVD